MIPDEATALREAGLRVTRPRVAVLAALPRQAHADADSIASAVRQELGSVSTQAVYDVLHALTDAGLVRRIEPAGSPARYELQTGDNHHHLVCRSCGRITDVACAVGEAPCLHPSSDWDFDVDEAEVIYWGTCPDCRAE
jgi:Fur family ferric uptake transcriptional regulator